MPYKQIKGLARTSKEQFRHRRAFLLKSAEAIRQDAAIYIVVRRSDVHYVYNSEPEQVWLPSKEDEIRPLYQQPTLANPMDETDKDQGFASCVDYGPGVTEGDVGGNLSISASSYTQTLEIESAYHRDLGHLILPEPSVWSKGRLCSTDQEAHTSEHSSPKAASIFSGNDTIFRRPTLRRPPSLWAKAEWNLKHVGGQQ